MRQRIHRVAAVALLAGAVGCSDAFYQITDPDQLESTAIDPVKDGPVLARSAFQNMVSSYGEMAVYIGWWAHEGRVGDTFPTRNEFGRRFLDDTNGTLNGVWFNLARAATTSEQVVNTLKDTPGLPLAIGAFAEAYALTLMAETFCEGTVSSAPGEPGPKMSTQQLLDLAILRFTLARSEAQKITGNSEAAGIATASLVGLARAHLQAGRKSEAATFARQVAASFVFDLLYLDDAANRGRVGNTVWSFSTARQSLVVPPEYRAMADAGDTRIKYEDTGRLAQDSELRFFRQLKFPTYGTSMRLASGLEARYIAAEASGDMAERIALINERRAVGRQGNFSSADPNAVLAELMEQRARDFWLDAKKMGDFRRNGFAVPYMLPDNGTYYKPGVGTVGDQKCWPVPDNEKRNNPNWS